MLLPTKSLIEWTSGFDSCTPSEHNRSELSVTPDRIKNSERMINGRLRQYYVADKRTWSVSWDMLPAPSSETVDGKAGGHEIEEFYYRNKGEFQMAIKHAQTSLDEEVTVVFESFSKTHVRRGAYDFWNLSITLEEC